MNPTSQQKKEAPIIPPIQPFSPQEISKFTALDLALRSHPELAREGASLLNPRALAKLVHGIKGFQDVHLGRVCTCVLEILLFLHMAMYVATCITVKLYSFYYSFDGSNFLYHYSKNAVLVSLLTDK
jgi:hypothetical protein